MKQWIADLFTDLKKDIPLAVFERDGLRARVTEQPRSCGHTGHIVELSLLFSADGEWHPIAVVGDTALRDAIILLQEVQEYVGQFNGVRELPTVRMYGTTYFFDARLGEFRNVENPNDRVGTVRIE
jgi:hypothetical protein